MVERRGRVLFFRRAYPKALAPHAPAREYIRTLQTADLAEAQEIRDVLEKALDLGWQHAERIINGGGDDQERHELAQLGPAGIVAHFTEQADEFLKDELIEREVRVGEALQLRKPGEHHPIERRVRGAFQAGREAATAEEKAKIAERYLREVQKLYGLNGQFVTETLEAAKGAFERVQEAQFAKLRAEQDGRFEKLRAEQDERFAKLAERMLGPAPAPPKPSPPIGEAVEQYLATIPKTSTRVGYARGCREFVALVGAELPVREVSFEDWIRYVEQRTAAENKVGTIITRLDAVGGFFSWAMKPARQWAGSNPVGDVKEELRRMRAADVKREKREGRRELTAAEIAKVLDPKGFADFTYARKGRATRLTGLLAPVLVGLHGMRPSEIGWLRPEAIEEVDGVLAIRIKAYDTPIPPYSKATAHPDGRYDPKTDAGERDVPVHPEIEDVLRRIAAARVGPLFLLAGGKTSPTGERTTAVSQRFLYHLDKLNMKGGNKRVDLYSLKHSCATQLKSAGVNQSSIGDILGHDKDEPGAAAVTGAYTHAGPMATRRANIAKLDPAPYLPLIRYIRENLTRLLAWSNAADNGDEEEDA